MKSILLFFVLALAAWGCQDSSKAAGDNCGLELTLVKMTSSWTGDQHTGDKLAWQETIVLSNDSTFFKRRNHDGTTYEATGRYKYVTLDNKKYVELTYSQPEDNIRTSCMAGSEHIEVRSSTQFINGEWAACDGPALEYKARPVRCDD